mmetsp:Transcript_46762/g.75333  ORF Transcript_46762/g.75333 Transcript_46762/m.75333 type:complete len:223 (-) Transcript_46762:424-1092(-)
MGAVDLAAALERCSGSLELLQQVVSETLNKAKTEQVPEIRQSIEGGDHTKAHFHSHSIKGASATIGFDGLSAIAKELDDLVRTGTVDGSVPLVDRLEAELEESLEYWKSHETAMAIALERCSDDQELFLEIAKEMISDVVPEQLTSLEKAVGEGDAASINICAVQLKDAAETIGASQLIFLLGPVITDTNDGKCDGCADSLQLIKEEAAKVSAFWEAVEADE